MRLEDLIVRYLPDGGTAADLRPDGVRGQLSFSADARVAVAPDLSAPDLVLLTPAQLMESVPAARWTVVLADAAPAAAPVADVLAWAGSTSGQLVEVCAILAPRCVALVVAATDEPLAPAVPGVPSTPGDAATWRRLAGELVVQRFRATVQAEELDRCREALEKERRRGDDARRRLRATRAKLKQAGRSGGGLTARVARLGRNRG